MAASITNIEIIGANAAVRYTWSGTAPFTAMARGVAVVQNNDQTSVILEHEDGQTHTQPVPIEVIDSTETDVALQQVLHPPNITLQFRGRRTNSYYKIELYVAALLDWYNGGTIYEDGRGYYQLTLSNTPTDNYSFRVTPYDESGTAGEPLAFTIFHHTNPIPPELTYTYASGGGGVVTVDEV